MVQPTSSTALVYLSQQGELEAAGMRAQLLTRMQSLLCTCTRTHVRTQHTCISFALLLPAALGPGPSPRAPAERACKEIHVSHTHVHAGYETKQRGRAHGPVTRLCLLVLASAPTLADSVVAVASECNPYFTGMHKNILYIYKKVMSTTAHLNLPHSL